MKITILDTCRRVSKAGKPYVQAAFRSTNRAGQDWLGIATVPDDLADFVGEVGFGKDTVFYFFRC